MKKIRLHIIASLSVVGVTLYACSSLPEQAAGMAGGVKAFSVEQVLDMVAKENDVTRTMYTKIIVGGLKKQGFKFDEDWRDDEVEAGPLPALFLRGVSADIRKSETPLGLYLGSDFPINDANKFQGQQATLFEQIKKDKKPQFFYDNDAKVYTAMFADVAMAGPCVSCHNGHEQTPKSDWKLGDVMGATTWQYPSDSLTYGEAMDVLKAYRNGTAAIYNEFIDEINAFKTAEKPTIGTMWPADGFYLPTAEVFIDSVRKVSAYETMKALIM